MLTNEPLTQQLRDQARYLLENEQVDCVIGYETSPRGGARPAFIHDSAEVDRLIWNAACIHNLVAYLHDMKKPRRRGEEPPRVAVVVKPCDSRAVNVPSYHVKVGDVIEVREGNRKVSAILEAMETVVRRGIPNWIEVEKENFRGIVKALPNREDLTMPIQVQLIVELYSK